MRTVKELFQELQDHDPEFSVSTTGWGPGSH